MHVQHPLRRYCPAQWMYTLCLFSSGRSMSLRVFFWGKLHEGSGTGEQLWSTVFPSAGETGIHASPGFDASRVSYFSHPLGPLRINTAKLSDITTTPPSSHPTHIHRYRPTQVSVKDHSCLWPQSYVASIDTTQNDNPGHRKAALLKEEIGCDGWAGPPQAHCFPP